MHVLRDKWCWEWRHYGKWLMGTSIFGTLIQGQQRLLPTLDTAEFCDCFIYWRSGFIMPQTQLTDWRSKGCFHFSDEYLTMSGGCCTSTGIWLGSLQSLLNAWVMMQQDGLQPMNQDAHTMISHGGKCTREITYKYTHTRTHTHTHSKPHHTHATK